MINYVRLTKEITSARARFTSASGACPLFLSGVVQDSKSPSGKFGFLISGLVRSA